MFVLARNPLRLRIGTAATPERMVVGPLQARPRQSSRAHHRCTRRQQRCGMHCHRPVKTHSQRRAATKHHFGFAHRPSPQTVALQRAASSAITAIRNTNRSRLKRKRPSPIGRHQPVGSSAHVLSRFLLTGRPAYRRRRLAGAVVRLDRRCLDHAAGCCQRRRQRLGARAGQPAGAVDRTDAGRRRGCLQLRRRRRCRCLGVIEPGGSRARWARPADRCASPAWQRLCGVAARRRW